MNMVKRLALGSSNKPQIVHHIKYYQVYSIVC